MRRLSDLPEDESRAALLACCGSSRWVERMLSQRPFRDRDDVFDSADRIWWDLEPADWLEAFGAHPRIGARVSGKEAHEQSGVTDDIREQLAEANAEYERRFGHIYLVCATGKTGAEMLDLCRSRLGNEPAAELRVAAVEQAKITRLRLEKLLELGS